MESPNPVSLDRPPASAAPPRSPRLGLTLVAGAAAGWGTWSLFFRPAERLGPLSAEAEAFVVMASMAAVGLPPALRSSRALARRPAAAWVTLGLVGVSDAINVMLFFKAMRLTSLAVAVLTHSLAPLLVAIASPLVTGERPSARAGVSVAGALAGLALLLRPWQTPAEGVVAGASAGAASAVFYAFNVLAQKRIASRFSAAEIVAYHSIVSALALALVAPQGALSLSGAQAAIIVPAALLLGGVGSLAFVRGLALSPASRASIITLLEPTVAVMVGAAVWGEPMGALGALGGAMVLASLAFAVSAPQRA